MRFLTLSLRILRFPSLFILHSNNLFCGLWRSDDPWQDFRREINQESVEFKKGTARHSAYTFIFATATKPTTSTAKRKNRTAWIGKEARGIADKMKRCVVLAATSYNICVKMKMEFLISAARLWFVCSALTKGMFLYMSVLLLGFHVSNKLGASVTNVSQLFWFQMWKEKSSGALCQAEMLPFSYSLQKRGNIFSRVFLLSLGWGKTLENKYAKRWRREAEERTTLSTS